MSVATATTKIMKRQRYLQVVSLSPEFLRDFELITGKTERERLESFGRWKYGEGTVLANYQRDKRNMLRAKFVFWVLREVA